jgi:hypothetical protein
MVMFILFYFIKRIFIQDVHVSSIKNCYQCGSCHYISLKYTRNTGIQSLEVYICVDTYYHIVIKGKNVSNGKEQNFEEICFQLLNATRP